MIQYLIKISLNKPSHHLMLLAFGHITLKTLFIDITGSK